MSDKSIFKLLCGDMSLICQAETSPAGGKRPGLYLGGRADAKDRAKLDRWSVSHILNVTPKKNANIKAGVASYFESSGAYVYKRIPVYDTPTGAEELFEAADDIVKFIAAGLCRGSVLVHCKRGVSRSSTAVLMYLMRRRGMGLTSALELVKRRRPQAEPIPAFMKMLERYEAQCRSVEGLDGTDKTEKELKRTRPTSGPQLPPTGAKKMRYIGPSLPPGFQTNVADDAKGVKAAATTEGDLEIPTRIAREESR